MSNRYNDLVLFSDNLADALDDAKLALEVLQNDYDNLECDYDDMALELEQLKARIPAWLLWFFR